MLSPRHKSIPFDPVRSAENEQAQRNLIDLRTAIRATQAGLHDWAEIVRLANAIEADPAHKLCGLLTEAELSTVARARSGR